MVILALDTATRVGSVALATDGLGEPIEVRVGDPTRTAGERLPQDVLDLLTAHGLVPRDVDRFAVIVGPGSFTGLRVGLATVQGFALASGRPIVPVPTLDAIVDGWAAERPGSAATLWIGWMDGQRGDVFYGAWSPARDGERGATVLEPRVGRPADLVRDVRLVAGERRLTFVNPGAVRGGAEVLTAFPAAVFETFTTPLAGVAARFARRHPELAVPPHAVRAVYLRRPDAELARARADREPPLPVTVVRLAPGEDLSEIAELQRRSFTNPWGADAIQWELANTDVARLYVARGADGTALAYCACWLLFDELHLNSLAVAESARRRGVARQLLGAVFRDAVASGARAATLEVRRSNDAARHLYERLGFVVDAVRRDYYQLPREDALILWHRQLAAPGRLW